MTAHTDTTNFMALPIEERAAAAASADGNGLQPEHYQEDALRSLELRYGGLPADARIVVHPVTGNSFATRLYKPNEFQQIARQHAGDQGEPYIYTRMTALHEDTVLAPGRRGTRTETYGACCLWVDVDPDGTDDFRERKLEELRRFHIPPSGIEDSGRGYYALWRIPFSTDWERIERVNRWLGLQLNGEGFDATRVLRLPGTFNGKPDCQRFARVLDQHPDRIYCLDDFAEADPSRDEEAIQHLEYEPEALPLDFEQRIRATEDVWNRIVSEESAARAGAPMKAGRPPRVDRSRNDAYIAARLLSMGVPREQVFTVLTHPTWFSGSKFRQHYSEAYVRRTIQSAARWIGSQGAGERLKPAVVSRTITEQVVLLRHLSFWYGYDPSAGVYQPYEQELRRAIQGIAGDKWTAQLEKSVLTYLEPNVTVDELFDHDLINCRNGMLDWQAGELYPHLPAYQSLYQVDAAWDPGADCAEVDALVAAILPEDTIPIFWMFSGYCLYTRQPLPYRALLALVGRKRTGKSTLLLALQTFLGQENCSAVSLGALGGSGNQFTTSSLVGKLLNIDLDAPYEVPLKDNHTLKKLAVGEPVQIERKHHPAFSATLPVKLAFVMNHYPTFGVADEALYDRWIVLTTRPDVEPFTRENRATRLNEHRRVLSQPGNKAAWLKRSIEGLQALQTAGGFPETENTRAALDVLRRESDSVYDFWLSQTEPAELTHTVPLQVIYNAYRAWVGETGGSPVKIKRFRARSSELVEEGLLPGMMLEHTNRWIVNGRRSLDRGVRVIQP